MKPAIKIVLAASTALTLALAALAVDAHPAGFAQGCDAASGAGPGFGHRGMGPGMGPGMGRFGPGFNNPQAIAEGHLAWLKAELKISPTQEAIWNTFADSQRQHAEAMAAWAKAVQEKAPTTALERMELRNQMSKKHQEQLEKRLASFKALYASLSVEQKAMLDQGLLDGGLHGGPGRGR